METLKFGMIYSIVPFTLIFLFLTMAWALVDISVRKLPGNTKAIWSVVVVLFPLVGALLYNAKVRLPDLAGHYKAHPAS